MNQFLGRKKFIEFVRIQAVDSVCAGSRQPWYGHFSIVFTAVFSRHRPVLVQGRKMIELG